MKVLTPDQRKNINTKMLEHTLGECSNLHKVATLAVISLDEQVLSIAERYKAVTIQESSRSGLNAAAKTATEIALANDARGVLILPADLPLLKSNHLLALFEESTYEKQMIITPDSKEYGTNAMLLFPPGMVEYCYGPNSFSLHTRQALEKGMSLIIHRNPCLEFDLDLPEDLIALRDRLGKDILE